MNKQLFSLPRTVKHSLFRRIIKQLTPPLELFLVDDVPSDDTAAIFFDKASPLADYFGTTLVLVPSVQISTYNERTKTTKLGRNPTVHLYCAQLCHEFGHRLQHIVYGDLACKTSDELVSLEKEVEEIGWMIYKEYFSVLISIDNEEFKVYKGDVLKELKRTFEEQTDE